MRRRARGVYTANDMPRHPLSKRMAQAAIAALLAAIEIYNKPTVEYREQTFAVLIVNAWEVLLKARILQENGNKIGSILEQQSKGNRIVRDGITGGKSTISLQRALNETALTRNARKNIEELVNVRNEAVHIGLIDDINLQEAIMEFGAASVKNFTELADQWFGEVVRVPYLLPVGFLTEAQLATSPKSTKQKDLLNRLVQVSSSADTEGDIHSVSLRVEVNITPKMTGGVSINPTSDPSALELKLTTDEMLKLFPKTHSQIRILCQERYIDFKANHQFNDLMKSIKTNAKCAFLRPYDPTNPKGSGKYFYNWDEVSKIFDGYYQKVTP